MTHTRYDILFLNNHLILNNNQDEKLFLLWRGSVSTLYILEGFVLHKMLKTTDINNMLIKKYRRTALRIRSPCTIYDYSCERLIFLAKTVVSTRYWIYRLSRSRSKTNIKRNKRYIISYIYNIYI